MHSHVLFICLAYYGVAKVVDVNQSVDFLWALTLTQELYCLAFRVGPVGAVVQHVKISLIHLVAFLFIAASVIVLFIDRASSTGSLGHNGQTANYVWRPVSWYEFPSVSGRNLQLHA
eukprot:CAMPEP_0202905566 /NCGR_PEP_ID=MMETSP1392-20130828/34928_1 /ASSEMBLY_ACC=CAM_ASM_000868 /TAXON_ID=225041 /ORGANISM="Chlamydomonas chlamydogama, Strain SAG 11-48b" /LENGTH=116 /DNA_ID=CAMNT_0049593717 /DNA_START=61 /DNA_END=414 /DNA_ORIENTATION=-